MKGTQSILLNKILQNLIYKQTLVCSWNPLCLLHLQRHVTLKIRVKLSKLKKKLYWQGCFIFALLMNAPTCKYYISSCVLFSQIWQTRKSRICPSAVILQREGPGDGELYSIRRK